MNRTRPFRPIRRLAGILAALATALLPPPRRPRPRSPCPCPPWAAAMGP
jgi:hypothetical protein